MLLSGMPSGVVLLLTVFFLAVLFLTLTFASYTRRINVNAEVITDPHTINLFASQQGIVARQFVNVGAVVGKGDPIYSIDISRTARSGNVSENVLTSIGEQIAEIDKILDKLREEKNTTIASMQRQLGQAEKASQETRKHLEDVRVGMETMRKTMRNYEQYLKEGIVTKEQLSSHQSQFYQQQSTYQSIQTQLNQQEIEMTRLRSDIATRSTTTDNQISEYENQKRTLSNQKSEADASGELLVNSQVRGKVTSMSVTPGQMVSTGDYLAQLVPATDYKFRVVLWIPNSSMPYVAVGDQINIRYDAFPYQKFGQFDGKIMTIAAAPATVQEMSSYSNAPYVPGTGLPEPYYKAIAEITRSDFAYRDKTLALSSGMRAQVTLFLEKRPLYQWILTPFYDIQKSLKGPVNE